MSWSVEPRFGYAGAATRLGWRAGVPIATASVMRSPCARSTPAPELEGERSAGASGREGTRALVALYATHDEPLVVPTRADVDSRLRMERRPS